MCFVILFKAIEEFYEKNKDVFKTYLIFMLFTIILSISNVENDIINLSSVKGNETTPVKIFGVYKYNINSIVNGTCIFTAKELKDIKKYPEYFDYSFLSNTEPERILWLINFIQPDKVDCPANNLYECINNLYYLDPDEYTKSNTDVSYYLFFSRSIYWKNSKKEFKFIEDIDYNSYSVVPTSFGYIIKEI